MPSPRPLHMILHFRSLKVGRVPGMTPGHQRVRHPQTREPEKKGYYCFVVA